MARDSKMFEHEWQLSNHVSPSGKILHYCPICGLYDPAPVKPKFEKRACIKEIYFNRFIIEEGKVYTRV